MTATCPKGHASTESDFCSECGAKINGSAGANTGAAREACPDCKTPRSDRGKFCELCGYNYETGAHGEIPMAPVVSAQPVEAGKSDEQKKWTIQVTIDPALKEGGSPDPPADWQPFTVAAAGETLLIGRTSKPRNILPEISLDFDTAVSHRHAVLTRSDGNGWSIRDIGSSNGTRVNGKDLQPMVDVPLQPGDRITVGHWTCLTVSRE